MNYNNRLRVNDDNIDLDYQILLTTKISEINYLYHTYLSNYSTEWINKEYVKTSNNQFLSRDCSNLSYTPGCYAKQDLFAIKPLKIKYSKSNMFKTVPEIKRQIRNRMQSTICPIATQLIKELLECNIIKKPINNNHKIICNPIYFKQKKPGKISIIYDGINSNRIIKNYVDFEIPHVYDILNDLKTFSHPTRIDINNAYFNTPISNKSKKLLGFIVNKEIYYWNCLPFGIANAPNLFIKTTDDIVKGISNNNNNLKYRKYFDDLIIEKEDKDLWVKELKVFNISVKDEGDQKFLGYEYNEKVLELSKDKLEIMMYQPDSPKGIGYQAMSSKIKLINEGRYIKPFEIQHNWKYYLNPDFKRFVKYNLHKVNRTFLEYIYIIICLVKNSLLPFRLADLPLLKDFLNVNKIRRILKLKRASIGYISAEYFFNGATCEEWRLHYHDYNISSLLEQSNRQLKK